MSEDQDVVPELSIDHVEEQIREAEDLHVSLRRRLSRTEDHRPAVEE